MNILNGLKTAIDGISDIPVKSFGGKLLMFIPILVIAFGILMLGWWIEQWLWNQCLASYFGWQPIGYWQMAGISVLFSSLFKSANTKSE